MMDLDRQIRDYYDRITIPVTAEEHTRPAVGVPVVQRGSRAWLLAAAFVVVFAVVGIPFLMGSAGSPSLVDQPSASDATTGVSAPAFPATVAPTVIPETQTGNQLDSVAGPFLVEGRGDILVTTAAEPLPAQATCPPGSDPDAPGPTDQERPYTEYGAMTFDRRAGRIVTLIPDDRSGQRTWTFDVCSNTWQAMHPPQEPSWDDPVTLVYDADSDLTLGFGPGGQVWSYDLAADRWIREGDGELPVEGSSLLGWVLGPAAVYHDPSGLVVVYDGASMWAYDVETNTLTAVDQLPDPSQPEGAGLPEGVTAVVYDRDRNLLLAVVATQDELRNSAFHVGESRAYESRVDEAFLEIWAFDPATGYWRLEPSQIPAGVLWQPDGWFYGPVGRVVFDEASGATLFLSLDGWVEAYDGRENWQAHPATAGGWCEGTLVPVYDPLNGRIVCRAHGGVSAFSTSAGEWTWLIKLK